MVDHKETTKESIIVVMEFHNVHELVHALLIAVSKQTTIMKASVQKALEQIFKEQMDVNSIKDLIVHV